MRYYNQEKGIPLPTYFSFFFFLFLIFLSSKSIAQDFKVVGYLPSYRFQLNDKIDYYKMTHLCLAFANPDAQGQLSFTNNADPRPIISNAKASGTKVFLSLAGGGLEEEWKRNWYKLLQPYYRKDFIQKIANYAVDNGFEGVDVDLEWKSVGEFYSDFVVELGEVLDFHGIEMTAALPGIFRYKNLTDEALRSFDWINLMAYDLTGPWKPSAAGPHAPYSLAQQSIDYWKKEGVPYSKMTLGLPFYGFDFSNKKKTKSATFGTIVKKNVHLAQKDRFGNTYYNGIPTIQDKTDLALQKVAGVMIWEIGQDSFDEYSLLNAIYERVHSRKETIISPILVKNEVVEQKEESIESVVFEEPFPDVFPETEIKTEEPITYDSWEVRPLKSRLVLLDFFGREIFQQKIESKESLRVHSGFFFNGWVLFESVLEGKLEKEAIIKAPNSTTNTKK